MYDRLGREGGRTGEEEEGTAGSQANNKITIEEIDDEPTQEERRR